VWRSLPGRPEVTYDIFEGTEQIQQLVIARAISGMRIE
jgi:alkylation response protein AidB-like acyl-CoA dehydrogenase